jgi:hypothetical protein
MTVLARIVLQEFERIFWCLMPLRTYFSVEANNDQARFEHFQRRWFFMRCLRPPTGLPARGKDPQVMRGGSIWTGRYEGIDEWLQNPNTVVDTDEKRLQREGSRRLGEGPLGGTPQKKLRSRYETGNRQGQTGFSFTASVTSTSRLFKNSHGHLLR